MPSVPTDTQRFASEPEAAAVHCANLTDVHRLTGSQNFMICDAGGGTVVRTPVMMPTVDVARSRHVPTHLGPSGVQDHWNALQLGNCRDVRPVGRELWFPVPRLTLQGADENTPGGPSGPLGRHQFGKFHGTL